MKTFFFSTKNFSNDLALLLLRITFGGIMFVNHGLGKIDKLQESPDKFMDFMGMGPAVSLGLVVFAEAACALLIVVGLATRFAVIPLIITMLVAVFVAHAGDSFSDIEASLIYLMAYTTLLITGPGKFSIDHKIA